MSLDKVIECQHRVLGDCKKCTKDYDTTHHPNNYDCIGYKPMRVYYYNVVEVKDDKIP